MDLQQRLAGRQPLDTRATDPFAEMKNRIHLAVIGDLGPQLFNNEGNPQVLVNSCRPSSFSVSRSKKT